MVKTALIFCAVLGGVAGAQERIGDVVLTPVAAVTLRPAPVPERGYSFDTVPAGMQEVRGRVGRALRGRALPAGSRVLVLVEDVTAAPRTLVSVAFAAPRLDLPYQVYFSPDRLQSGRRYVLRAEVRGAGGELLYRGAAKPLLRGPRMTADLDLRAP